MIITIKFYGFYKELFQEKEYALDIPKGSTCLDMLHILEQEFKKTLRMDIPRTGVSRTEVPRTEVPRMDIPRTGVSRTEVPHMEHHSVEHHSKPSFEEDHLQYAMVSNDHEILQQDYIIQDGDCLSLLPPVSGG